MSGLPFGPSHPYRQTTEMARKAGKSNKGKTPWRNGSFLRTAKDRPARGSDNRSTSNH